MKARRSATHESGASMAYRAMILAASPRDIVHTSRRTGVGAIGEVLPAADLCRRLAAEFRDGVGDGA